MIKIVHWHDIVGAENLDAFCKIQKAIIYAERNKQTETDVFERMKGEEAKAQIEMWKRKRHWMRFCGYGIIPEDNRVWKRYGWFAAYLDNEHVRFSCTAPREQREYITLSQFMDWKKGVVEDAAEADYYGETQRLIDDLVSSKSVPKTKPRKDIDFPPEDDELTPTQGAFL